MRDSCEHEHCTVQCTVHTVSTYPNARRTILLLSCVYAAGNLVVAVTSLPMPALLCAPLHLFTFRVPTVHLSSIAFAFDEFTTHEHTHTHTHHLAIVCCTSSVGAIIGLLLIACGSGGIKPCVSAFGADQFGSSEREQLSMSRFFSVFYFFMCAFDSPSSLFSSPLLYSLSSTSNTV